MNEISPELALVDPELAAEARAALADPSPAPEPERPRFRRRALLLAGLVSAAGVAAVATLTLVRDGDGSGPSAEPVPTTAEPVPTTDVLGAKAAAPPSPRLAPAGGPSSRLYAWDAVEGAVFYEVTFVRNGETFHTAETTVPWLRLPTGLRLPPGDYRWSVRPALARDSGVVVGDAVLVRTFRVGRR